MLGQSIDRCVTKNMGKIHKCILKNDSVDINKRFPYYRTFDGIDYVLCVEDSYRYVKRQEIVNTLKAIDYKRNEDKWNRLTIVAFLHELICLRACAFEDCDGMLERYNIAENRVNNQSVFFINARNSYGLSEYFTDEELIAWKYRDRDLLATKLNNNKVSESDLEVLLRLGIVKENKEYSEDIHNHYTVK